MYSSMRMALHFSAVIIFRRLVTSYKLSISTLLRPPKIGSIPECYREGLDASVSLRRFGCKACSLAVAGETRQSLAELLRRELLFLHEVTALQTNIATTFRPPISRDKYQRKLFLENNPRKNITCDKSIAPRAACGPNNWKRLQRTHDKYNGQSRQISDYLDASESRKNCI